MFIILHPPGKNEKQKPAWSPLTSVVLSLCHSSTGLTEPRFSADGGRRGRFRMVREHDVYYAPHLYCHCINYLRLSCLPCVQLELFLVCLGKVLPRWPQGVPWSRLGSQADSPSWAALHLYWSVGLTGHQSGSVFPGALTSWWWPPLKTQGKAPGPTMRQLSE